MDILLLQSGKNKSLFLFGDNESWERTGQADVNGSWEVGAQTANVLSRAEAAMPGERPVFFKFMFDEPPFS